MKISILVKYLIWIIVSLTLIIQGTAFVAAAQGTNFWSSPQIIPGYSDDVLTPHLVAGRNGKVHAFVSDWVGESNPQKAVFYSQWDQDQGWTLPTDILLSPNDQARVKGAFLDSDDMMHVVFFGGGDTNAAIYYSKAAAALANQTQSWSKPVIVSEKAITPDEAAIAGDDSGNIHIIFGAALDGNSLYSVHSSDGGETWSDPTPIYLTFSDSLWPGHLHIFVDSDSHLHAVWSVGDLPGNGLAVYYAKLAAGTFNWTEPIVLAQAVGLEADTPSIIDFNNELIVVYHNDNPTTRWMRRSRDGGQSWTEPTRLFPQVGSNGAASMVLDSGHNLHMFFGNRLAGPPMVYGMWQSTWNGISWSTPAAIISGPKRDDFDPSFAHAVVSQGNTILVAWHEDSQAINSRGASFSFLNLDTPAITESPQSTAANSVDVMPVESIGQSTVDPATATNNLEIIQNHGAIQSAKVSGSLTPIQIGVIPVIVLLLIFLFIRLGSRYIK